MHRLKQAVILVGGRGTRLFPLTKDIPKPMVKIHGKPFLEYIISLLKKNDIKKILILSGYKHKTIVDYFKDGKSFGVEVSYSVSPADTDTGSRIKNAQNLLESQFLLLYGDNYWPLDLPSHESFYRRMNVPYLVTVYSNYDHSTKNNIRVGKKGLVETYDRKRKKRGLTGVDIGYFILDRKIVSYIPKKNSSFEEDVLPILIQQKALAGFVTFHKYYSLSTPDRIPAIKSYFQRKKIIFLDRDGVINKKAQKAHYVTSWRKFEYLPKVKDALLILKKKGYSIFIITNQAGIARGIVTQKQVDRIHKLLIRDLESINVDIGGIYVCPHGWDEGCFCRKPNPGLFYKAAAEHYFNLYESYCIGDDPRDMIAGKNAGCKTYLVGPGKSLYSIVEKLP